MYIHTKTEPVIYLLLSSFHCVERWNHIHTFLGLLALLFLTLLLPHQPHSNYHPSSEKAVISGLSKRTRGLRLRSQRSILVPRTSLKTYRLGFLRKLSGRSRSSLKNCLKTLKRSRWVLYRYPTTTLLQLT